SFATERLRQTVLGRWVDQIRLEASNPDAAATTPGQGTLQTYLFNTRLAGDKELLKDRVYLSFSTGLCGFNPTYRQQTSQDFLTASREQFGLATEWRFKSTLHSGS